MRVPVHSVQDVGMAVRVVRKSSGVRQDDAAGSAPRRPPKVLH